jgi:hypothetical protein
MNRLSLIATAIVLPIAIGTIVLLLAVAGLVKVFSEDKQGLASLCVDMAITIGAGAAVVIAIAYFAQ